MVSPYLQRSFTTPHAAKNVRLKTPAWNTNNKKNRIKSITWSQIYVILLRKHVGWCWFSMLMNRPSASPWGAGGGYFLQCAGQWAEHPPHPAVRADGVRRSGFQSHTNSGASAVASSPQSGLNWSRTRRRPRGGSGDDGGAFLRSSPTFACAPVFVLFMRACVKRNSMPKSASEDKRPVGPAVSVRRSARCF